MRSTTLGQEKSSARRRPASASSTKVSGTLRISAFILFQSAVAPLGTPGVDGMPSVASPEPALDLFVAGPLN